MIKQDDVCVVIGGDQTEKDGGYHWIIKGELVLIKYAQGSYRGGSGGPNCTVRGRTARSGASYASQSVKVEHLLYVGKLYDK